jgi:hypothetical protein
MIGQGRIGYTGCQQGHHRDDTSGLHVYRLLIPYFPEQNIIIQMREHGREPAELTSSCCLDNLFTHPDSSFDFRYITYFSTRLTA